MSAVEHQCLVACALRAYELFLTIMFKSTWIGGDHVGRRVARGESQQGRLMDNKSSTDTGQAVQSSAENKQGVLSNNVGVGVG